MTTGLTPSACAHGLRLTWPETAERRAPGGVQTPDHLIGAKPEARIERSGRGLEPCLRPRPVSEALASVERHRQLPPEPVTSPLGLQPDGFPGHSKPAQGS